MDTHLSRRTVLWALSAASLGAGLAACAKREVGELVVFNGFDEPVEVVVGSRRQRVEPRSHIRVSGIAEEVFAISAQRLDGSRLEVLENLRAMPATEILYNVASRGVFRARVADGSDPPQMMPPGPLQALPTVRRLFERPGPDAVASGQDLWVTPVELPREAQAAYLELAWAGLYDHGRAVVEAEARLRPDNAAIARLAIMLQASSEPVAAAARARELKERLPEEAEAHLAYQLYGRVEPRALWEEYTALAEARVAEALPGYLLSRLVPPDQRPELLLAALERNPDYAPALRDLAVWRAERGDYAGAAELMKRRLAAGPLDINERANALRIARMLGEDPSPLLGDERGFSAPWGALIEVQADPARADEVVARLDAREVLWPPAVAEAEVRLAAGDLVRTRELVRRPEVPRLVAMRLALSDGATDEDIEAVRADLGRPDDSSRPGTPRVGVLLWALAARLDPGGLPRWIPRTLGTGVLADLLPALASEPEGVRSPEQVDARVRGDLDLVDQGAVYAALASLHREGPASRVFRDRARRLLLPQEGPWFQPPIG